MPISQLGVQSCRSLARVAVLHLVTPVTQITEWTHCMVAFGSGILVLRGGPCMTDAVMGVAAGVRNILYLTDLSETSDAALPFASAAAQKYDAKVHVFCALPPAHYGDEAPTTATSIAPEREIARENLQKLQTKVTIVPDDVTTARPPLLWDMIERAIAHSKADLIVFGTGRRSGELRLTGFVAGEILRRSPVPVMAIGPGVREELDSGAVFQVRSVLVASDLAPDSTAATRYAVRFAQDSHARLILVHILRIPQRRAKKQPGLSVAEAIYRLYGRVPEDLELWCTPEAWVEYGTPALKVLEVAEKRCADLIVLGTHGASVDAAEAHQDMVPRIVAAARCPVVTVPSDTGRKPSTVTGS
jgi:nucleotide-binding universal stress UspA family protein